MFDVILAWSMTTRPECDWSNPGRNRFTGNPIKAVSRLGLDDWQVREIQIKIKAGVHDDDAIISKDEIHGSAGEYIGLSNMFFASNTRCSEVSRTSWGEDRKEPARVYCASNAAGASCVIIPEVCGNVSLTTRKNLGNTKVKPIPRSFHVPEPSSILLVGLAVLALLSVSRKKL